MLNRDKFHGESSDLAGRELEEAYASAFGGQINGGVNDRGEDILLNDPEVPAVQVKASLESARHFFREAIRREEFIPICIGEPGAKEEMVQTLKEYGAWVGHEIIGREDLLEKISNLRALCEKKGAILEGLSRTN